MQVTPRRVQSDKEIRVNFRVTNTGSVAGTEVAQVYLSLPGRPRRAAQATGWLGAGHAAAGRAQEHLGSDRPELVRRTRCRTGNVNTDSWKTQAGNYTFMVGSSSRDLPLTDTIQVWVKN